MTLDRGRASVHAGVALALAFAGASLAPRGAPGLGTAFLAAAAVAAALATIPGGLPAFGRRWVGSFSKSPAGGVLRPATDYSPAPAFASRPAWVVSGLLLAVGAALWNGQNRFTLLGLFAWGASIASLLRGLSAPEEARRPNFALPSRAALLTLLALTLAGGALRFGAFSAVPPEPTSDHVEKALDAVRIADGARPVFCATNGGREPLQMYLLALLALLPGFGFGLSELTFLTALEGTLTIPLFFLAAHELARPRGRRAAQAAGLASAGLAAVSGWHLVLSRLGLRIVLLPAVTLLLLTFLLRAAREGRRRDFLAAGVVLGLGFYTYQSVRFLPFLVAAAALLAVRDTRPARDRLRRGLFALVLVAGACVVPLARYAAEYPREFWARARTRVLGDTDASDPSGALLRRVPDLLHGVQPALAALHVAGDRGWFQGAPGRPFLDPVTGSLFAAGVGLILAGALRRRDRAALLVPASVVLLLLPSAVAAAHPIENPSTTRASGALAPVILVAGSGLAWAVRTSRARGCKAASAAVAALLLIGPALSARAVLLEAWLPAYAAAAHPHREMAAEVAAFVHNGGRAGNVFVVGVPHGADDRAVAMEAGLAGRSPGLGPAERPLVKALGPAFGGVDERRKDFDPDGALLFLLSPRDEGGLDELLRLFPRANVLRVAAAGPDHGFLRVEAPAETPGGRAARVGLP